MSWSRRAFTKATLKVAALGIFLTHSSPSKTQSCDYYYDYGGDGGGGCFFDYYMQC